MAVLEILKFPDPRLRKKGQPVDEVTPELAQLAHDMVETMQAEKGIGLAAAQVNRQVRLLVADTRPFDENGEPQWEQMTELERQVEMPFIIFNPEIKSWEGTTTFDEGCLSLPGYYETVERYNVIEVEGLNVHGEKFKVKTDGLLAICIQHEIDHLDGKLFVDRLSPIKSTRIKSKIKKYGYPEEDKQKKEKELSL